jgi:hypothetical protein
MGPPQKDGHEVPVLPYQRTIYEALNLQTHLDKVSRYWPVYVFVEIYRLVLCFHEICRKLGGLHCHCSKARLSRRFDSQVQRVVSKIRYF